MPAAPHHPPSEHLPGSSDPDETRPPRSASEQQPPEAAATSGPPVASVAFGVDTLGQWRVDILDAADRPVDVDLELTLEDYPTGELTGALALQQALQEHFPGVPVTWRPGVMNTLDAGVIQARRALAAAAADRVTARDAEQQARTSLVDAVRAATSAGIGPVEMSEATGYARSTITKIQQEMPAEGR